MTQLSLIAVPDWPAAEAAIRTGIDSSRVVVVGSNSNELALQAARAGIQAQRGPLPTKPHSLGLRCLVVLPTYNERESLESILVDILAYLETDILVVDDGSPDGTGLLADQFAAKDPRVSVLHRAGKQGLGSAYIAGFRHALAKDYDRVFEMDADFSHPPWDLPRLGAASADAELVIGSRYVAGGNTVGWDFRRRLLSRGANFYARNILGLKVRDLTAGFRCFRTEFLAGIDLRDVYAGGYAFQIEMAFRIARAGGRIVEVPIHFTDRRVGSSKMSGKIAREALLLVPSLRRRVPKRPRTKGKPLA